MEVSMWTGLPVKLPSSRVIKLKTVNKLPSIIMLIFPDIKFLVYIDTVIKF